MLQQPDMGALLDSSSALDEVATPAEGPAVAPSWFESRLRQIASDENRRGLPWEREPLLDTFVETVKWVITSPADAFNTMRLTGGIMNPLGFLVVAAVMAQVLLVIEVLVIGGIGLFLWRARIAQLGHNLAPFPWETFFVTAGIAAIVMIVGAAVGAAIGGFFIALLLHVCLLVVGGARAGYQATYRVVALAYGSVYMLMTIPVVGPVFALVMQPVLLTYGLRQAHDTSGWRAFLAVCLLLFLLVGCVVIFIVPNLPALPLAPLKE
ncbi:MAG TPA: hypothetical protein VKH44_04230 [Pirellulaceae bacterium]|nr:hypothetical protein [Pirellulaceae bacterium]